jgi:DNA-binding transcriptional regulator YiaG
MVPTQNLSARIRTAEREGIDPQVGNLVRQTERKPTCQKGRDVEEDPDAELCEEDIISPWYIRKRLGMSQQQFANTLGIPIATLRNWEQHRVMMEPSTVALMRIMAHEPKAALRALRRPAT